METIDIKSRPTSVRFSDASWFSPGVETLIGGAGGIGSWLTFFLARQECDIYLYDDDMIDETNLGGQLYAKSFIGVNKATAMNTISSGYCDNSITCMGRYEKDSFSMPIMFSAFDNMTARKTMFNRWKECEDRKIFIDGRMLAESAQIISVTKDNEDKYEEELFEDSEVEDQPCSMKATSHCGAITAGYMVATFNNYMANSISEHAFREVPFKTTIELPTLTQDVIL